MDVKFIVMGVGIAVLSVAVAVLVLKKRNSFKKPDIKSEEIGLENAAIGNAFVVGGKDTGKI